MSYRTRRPKLTAEQVAQIKRQLADGARRQDIALAFGVSAANIGSIQRGETWGWVAPAESDPEGAS